MTATERAENPIAISLLRERAERGRGGSLLTQPRCAHPIVPGERNSSPSPSLRVRAIAYGETVAFLSSVIPAQAGIQCPKTRHSPLDSRLRGNDGNREVGEPKCDCPTLGRRGRKSDFADSSPEMCQLHSRQGGTEISEGY